MGYDDDPARLRRELNALGHQVDRLDREVEQMRDRWRWWQDNVALAMPVLALAFDCVIVACTLRR